MTICIASICEKGKKLIVAADQMMTASIPMPYEFETDDVQKIYPVNDTAVILTAGNALYAYQIVEKAIKKVNQEDFQGSVKEIAELVRQEFVMLRREIIERNVLEPRGLSFEDYYNIQQKLVPGVIQEIESNLVGFNLGVELIIGGKDEENIYHLYTVTSPGQLVNHDAIGFVCIGSGSPHATYHLIGESYKKTMNLDKAKELIEASKKRSEVAPGVGKATTIKVYPE